MRAAGPEAGTAVRMCFYIVESIAFFAVIWYIEVKRKPLKTANLFGLKITARVQVSGGYFFM